MFEVRLPARTDSCDLLTLQTEQWYFTFPTLRQQ